MKILFNVVGCILLKWCIIFVFGFVNTVKVKHWFPSNSVILRKYCTCIAPNISSLVLMNIVLATMLITLRIQLNKCSNFEIVTPV